MLSIAVASIPNFEYAAASPAGDAVSPPGDDICDTTREAYRMFSIELTDRVCVRHGTSVDF